MLKLCQNVCCFQSLAKRGVWRQNFKEAAYSFSRKHKVWSSYYTVLHRTSISTKMEINEILPLETFVFILKKLDYKSIIIAQLTCKRWREVIRQFELTKACLKNQCKYLLFANTIPIYC